MRKHDFYGLPRSLQDRFIESSRGAAVPAPLLVRAEGDATSRNWALAALGLAALWAGYFFFGFGDLDSPLALGGPLHMAGHVLFAATVSFCAFRSFGVSWEGSRIPYGYGWFLFPSGVIHTKGGSVTEYGAEDIKGGTVSGSSVAITFQNGRTVLFPAADADNAQAAVAAFEAGQKKWSSLSEQDALERARLNPLTESGVPNPLAPTDPHPRPVLFRPVVLVLVTVLAGATLGFAVSQMRQSLSEKALYRAAIHRDTVEAYEKYLARGGDRAEVRELLLPRARLEQAIAAGTVDAIEKFQRQNPDLKIEGEVQNALRATLLAELDKAKEKGSLQAIDAMPERFEAHALIAGEIAQARRDVFAKALADFQKVAAPDNAELVPFVQRLLTYTEKHGPKVKVRLSQDFPQEPEKVDSIVRKSRKYYLGSKSLPTQYFLGERARAREKQLGEQIVERLQQAFPKDVVNFELAPLPEKENVELEEPEVPTLTISHQERLSGGFVGGKPKSMYMGATLVMTARFELPGEPDNPLEFRWSAWLRPSFTERTDSPTDIADVYEDMIAAPFERFSDKYAGQWFKEP